MLFFNRKWKLYLYLNGVCIKKLKINMNKLPNLNINENVFVFNVFFKKQIYGSNLVKIIVRPTKVIYTNAKKKETHWEFIYEKGTDIDAR